MQNPDPCWYDKSYGAARAYGFDILGQSAINVRYSKKTFYKIKYLIGFRIGKIKHFVKAQITIRNRKYHKFLSMFDTLNLCAIG